MRDEVLKTLDTLDPQRIDFPGAFVSIEAMADAAGRGRALEKLFAALLRRDGYRAWHNPGAAHPRQTDVAFEADGALFLVETKWRRCPANIDDLDALRSRVRRCPAGTAGCLVSMEGFTATVADDLRDHRTDEIVLFEGDEVRQAVLGELSLADAIREKRRRFRVDGEVWFTRDERRRAAPVVLPHTRYSVVSSGVPTCSVATRTGHHAAMHFLIDAVQLESYWATTRFDVNVRAGNVADLARVLSGLHERLQLDNEGSFAIHQTRDSWFGFGAEQFVAELQGFNARYAKIPDEHIHHSEDASFVSHFRGGLLAVSTRQRVSTSPHLHSTRLEIFMDGVPLNLETFRDLAREFAGEDVPLRIMPQRGEDERNAAWLAEPLGVEPVALVLGKSRVDEDDDTYVDAIVAKNPYLGNPAALRAAVGELRWVPELAEVELLVCWLRSSHGVSDKVDAYRLQRLEYQQFGSMQFITAEVDWGAITECRCQRANHHERLSRPSVIDRVRGGMKRNR